MVENDKFTIYKHVAITAGAGSGKTYTLSRRYINALLGFDFFNISKIPQIPQSVNDAKKFSAKPIEIVTTTFTEAGAMEMKSRIESLILQVIDLFDNPESIKLKQKIGIDNISNINEEWKNYIKETLINALHTIHFAIISTIHKFALSIIKRNVELVPMDTTIDVIDDSKKQEIFNSVWFEVINDKKNENIYLDLNNKYSVYNIEEFAKRYTFNTRIRDGFEKFIQQLGSISNIKNIFLKLYFSNNIEKILDAFEKFEGNLKIYNEQPQSHKDKNPYIEDLKKFLENIFQLNVAKLSNVKVKGNSQLFTPIRSLFSIKFDEDIENSFEDIIKNIDSLIQQVRKKYFNKIEQDGKLDFDRILEAANSLVKNPKANLRRYKYFFVDEFQDTNEIQWNLIKNSANLYKDEELSANIFLVGDEKQSIFEFQGAEVSTFAKAIEDIKHIKGESSIITPKMVDNYRSDQSIISFVNEVFESIMVKDKLYPVKRTFDCQLLNDFLDRVYEDYLQNNCHEHEVEYQALNSMSKNKGTVKVLVKDIPKSKNEEEEITYNASQMAIHEANMIAYFINEIKNKKYENYLDISQKIEENKKAIAILCDAKANMILIKNALKKYGIESKVSASEDFYQAREIIDIFYVLAMINYFKDNYDFSIKYSEEKDFEVEKHNRINQQKRFFLVGALNSKVLRYSDVQIKEIIESNTLPEQIKELVKLPGVLSLSDLINYIVEKYEVKRVYAHFDDYAQTKANIKKLLSMAVQFKPLYKSAFEEFVEMLETNILNSDSNIEDQAFYESNQTNAIEIRTMHSSKGLAWSMVIIPELGRSLQGKNQTLNYASYSDGKDRLDFLGFSIDGQSNISNEIAKTIQNSKKYAEKKRLLYVAMTRPEKHLVLSLSKNNKSKIENNSYWGMWLSNIDISLSEEYIENEIKDNEFLNKRIDFQRKISDVLVEIEIYENQLDQQNEKYLQDKLESKIFDIENITYNKYEDDYLSEEIINPFESKKAADFGILAHLILELCFKDKIFNTEKELKYIDDFIKTNSIDESQRLKNGIENFKNSGIYSELNNSEIVLFEQAFNFFDLEKNYNQKRIIDLLYFYNGKWNIIDFKSNAFNDRSYEEIILEHSYDKQLQEYFNYVASKYGKNSINRCQILWLEDGQTSDMIGVDK